MFVHHNEVIAFLYHDACPSKQQIPLIYIRTSKELFLRSHNVPTTCRNQKDNYGFTVYSVQWTDFFLHSIID